MSAETLREGMIVRISTAWETGEGGSGDPVAVVMIRHAELVHIPLVEYHDFRPNENVLVKVGQRTRADNGEPYKTYSLEHNSNREI